MARKCNGKCYLMMKFQSQEEEKKHGLPQINIEEYPMGFVKFLQLITCIKPFEVTSQNDSYQNRYRYRYAYLDFHPPAKRG